MAVTIIVEDGSRPAGANSYSSLADAVAFLNNLPSTYTTQWTAASDDLKSQALIMGTHILDSEVQWKGVRMDPDTPQPRQWPRWKWPRKTTAVFIKTPQEDRAWWNDGTVPPVIKEACIEMALCVLSRNLISEFGTEGIKSVVVGGTRSGLEVQFDKDDRPFPIPPYIRRKIAPFVLQQAGQSCNFNVVRA